LDMYQGIPHALTVTQAWRSDFVSLRHRVIVVANL
jgi:hypothetical protein